MGFFEPPPPPPAPPARPPAPEWRRGAATNVLPASFPLEALLARTDELALQAHTGRAYPNGFEFVLSRVLRQPHDGPFDDPLARPHRREGSRELADDVLRFGIELADGRKATIFDLPPFADDEPAPEAVLRRGSGNGGGNRWEFRYWFWPIPPPGPLTFVVEWPSEGVPLTRTEIDAEPIRAAAERALELWPESRGREGGSWVRYA